MRWIHLLTLSTLLPLAQSVFAQELSLSFTPTFDTGFSSAMSTPAFASTTIDSLVSTPQVTSSSGTTMSLSPTWTSPTNLNSTIVSFSTPSTFDQAMNQIFPNQPVGFSDFGATIGGPIGSDLYQYGGTIYYSTDPNAVPGYSYAPSTTGYSIGSPTTNYQSPASTTNPLQPIGVTADPLGRIGENTYDPAINNPLPIVQVGLALQRDTPEIIFQNLVYSEEGLLKSFDSIVGNLNGIVNARDDLSIEGNLKTHELQMELTEVLQAIEDEPYQANVNVALRLTYVAEVLLPKANEIAKQSLQERSQMGIPVTPQDVVNLENLNSWKNHARDQILEVVRSAMKDPNGFAKPQGEVKVIEPDPQPPVSIRVSSSFLPFAEEIGKWNPSNFDDGASQQSLTPAWYLSLQSAGLALPTPLTTTDINNYAGLVNDVSNVRQILREDASAELAVIIDELLD